MVAIYLRRGTRGGRGGRWGVVSGSGEEDELFGVALHLCSGDDETKVIEEEELEFELV
jgi:hypothetical protein